MDKFNDEWLYGLQGLADFLNCSRITAQRYKLDGKIPFKQIGRKIIFNKTEVLKAMTDEQTYETRK